MMYEPVMRTIAATLIADTIASTIGVASGHRPRTHAAPNGPQMQSPGKADSCGFGFGESLLDCAPSPTFDPKCHSIVESPPAKRALLG